MYVAVKTAVPLVVYYWMEISTVLVSIIGDSYLVNVLKADQLFGESLALRTISIADVFSAAVVKSLNVGYFGGGVFVLPQLATAIPVALIGAMIEIPIRPLLTIFKCFLM